VRIDLTQLEMDAPTRAKRKLKKEDEALFEVAFPASAAAATESALNWLGLGEEVKPDDQNKNRSAVFEFHSLRELSHSSAHTGALRTGEGATQVRQVYATAEGELSIRGLSVERQLPLLLRFFYPEKSSAHSVPTSIEVGLRPNMRVPLEEYEIEPRGPSGSTLSEQLRLLGRSVGSSADVRGTVLWKKAKDP
jgi:hypothetical protein